MHRIVNLAEVWRLLHAASGRGCGREKNPGAAWDKKAAVYDIESGEKEQKTPPEIAFVDIRPGETVLDIGAGTGRLAAPLARAAGRVYALDPSEGMLARLRDRMEKEDLKNCECIHLRWEDAVPGENVPVCDVVIASYSLGFADIKDALRRIDAAARRRIYLFWHAGEWRTEGEKKLWEAVFGPAGMRKGYPDYLLLVGVLHSLGIYADVRIFETVERVRYTSPAEAAERWALLHEPPEGMEEVIEARFETMLTPADGGGYIHVRKRLNAAVSWEKSP